MFNKKSYQIIQRLDIRVILILVLILLITYSVFFKDDNNVVLENKKVDDHKDQDTDIPEFGPQLKPNVLDQSETSSSSCDTYIENGNGYYWNNEKLTSFPCSTLMYKPKLANPDVCDCSCDNITILPYARVNKLNGVDHTAVRMLQTDLDDELDKSRQQIYGKNECSRKSKKECKCSEVCPFVTGGNIQYDLLKN